MAISSLPSKHAEAAPCPIDTPAHNIQGPVSQVMTVGLSRPVNSTSLEMSNATEMMGASAACASSLCLDTSSLYCSMYILRRRRLLSSVVACAFSCVVQQALGSKRRGTAAKHPAG